MRFWPLGTLHPTKVTADSDTFDLFKKTQEQMNNLHWDIKELKSDMKQLAFQVSQIKDNQTKVLEEVTKLRRRTSSSDKPHRNVSK